MQIDWLSAMVECQPGFEPGWTSGHHVRIGPDGEVVSRKAAPLDVEDEEPSSSRAFRVWTPQPHSLYLSGNPVKLLQGHNLFGSCDVPGLYLEAGLWVYSCCGLFPSPDQWESCRFGVPRFTRIDVTRSYRFESVAVAQSFIRHVAGAARSKHGAAKLYGSETAIFGQGSRRWSLKVYDKFSELRASLKREDRGAGLDDELFDWARGVVRFELTLRSLEIETLQDALIVHESQGERSGSWDEVALRLWQGYYDRITWNENAAMREKSHIVESTLSGPQRAALALWRAGEDLRTFYPHRTFYRHRLALLEKVGVDIATPPSVEEPAQASASLDPAGWDPESIRSRLVEPAQDLKRHYKLL